MTRTAFSISTSTTGSPLETLSPGFLRTLTTLPLHPPLLGQSSMVSALSHVIDYVDGVIAHAFIGLKGGLEGLKSYLDSAGVKLILVISMSHAGSLDVIDVNVDRLLWVAGRLKPWGLVAPATRPHVISYARGRAPWAVILAPGVGVQGARPGDGIRAGADYEIVGRLVTEASNPVEVVNWINGEHVRALKERGG